MSSSLSYTSNSDDESDAESQSNLVDVQPEWEMLDGHAYLGSDLRALESPEIKYDPETLIENVTLVRMNRVVVMPGQAFPILWQGARAMNCYRRIIEDRGAFGVVYSVSQAMNDDEVDNDENLADIGTLSQILFHSVSNSNNRVYAVCVGRQRFHLEQANRDQSNMLAGKVKVMPEILEPDFLCSVRCAATPPVSWNCNPLANFRGGLPDAYLPAYFIGRSWPLFHRTSVYCVKSDIAKNVANWTTHGRMDTMLKKPISFFYWIAANLPVTRSTKLSILAMKSCNQQMMHIQRILKNLGRFVCRECQTVIGSYEDIISIARQGPTNIYVNPNGVVGEVVTLRRASNIEIIGSPQTLMTWFVGFEWSVILCYTCGSHLGWKFTAEEGANMYPEEFYGCSLVTIATADGESF